MSSIRLAGFVGLLLAPTLAIHAQTWEPLGEPGVGGWVTGLAVSPHDPDRVLVGGDMLGVGLSLDGGDSWQPTSGFESWEIASFTWHPVDANEVWAGTMSGPYVSRDGGATWIARRNGLPDVAGWSFSAPIEVVLFDPIDDDRLLAFGGSSRGWPSGGDPAWGAVWESTNGGDDWIRLTTLTATGSDAMPDGNDLVVVGAAFGSGSSSRVYAAVRGFGFYRSDDGGATWSVANVGLPHVNAGRLAVDPSNVDRVYLALDADGTTPGGVYRSVDGGTSWVDASTGLAQVSGIDQNRTSRYRALVVAPTDGQRMYTSDSRWGSVHGVATSSNGATSWTSVVQTGDVETFTPAGINMTVLAVDPTNADRAFAAGSSHILRTEDGGATWEDVSATRVSDGFVGTGYTGWVCRSVTFSPDPDRFLLQGMDAARVLLTEDGGESWRRVATDPTPYQGGRDAVFAGGSRVYASLGQANFQGIARSDDAGATWVVLAGAAAGLPELGEGDRPDGVHADAASPDEVWAAVNGTLRYSADAGATWSIVLDEPGVAWMAADPSTTARFFVSTDVGAFRTDDGQTFTFIGGPERPGRLAVDADGRLLHAAHDGTGSAGLGLWRYDGGWTQLFDDAYAVGVDVDPTYPDRIAVSTADNPFHDVSRASGVYLSSDGGATWISTGDGLPIARGEVIAFNPHDPEELILGTSGRGFFRARFPAPLSTGAVDGTHSGRLSARRQGTRVLLEFSLPVAGAVQIDVHDVRGRRVTTLVDRGLATGSHRLDAPADLPAGVYFVALSAPTMSARARLVIDGR